MPTAIVPTVTVTTLCAISRPGLRGLATSATIPDVAGRRIAAPTDGPLAQLAEQLTLNQWVVGSSPTRLTTKALATWPALLRCWSFWLLAGQVHCLLNSCDRDRKVRRAPDPAPIREDKHLRRFVPQTRAARDCGRDLTRSGDIDDRSVMRYLRHFPERAGTDGARGVVVEEDDDPRR